MNLFEEVKASIKFEDVARDYDISFNRNKALCPFHEDHKISGE